MRLAHFGTFDVENYGDLLFPLLLEHRLSDLCQEFVHVSPTGGPPPWNDCIETVGFDTFLRETPDIDGVVIGGGQIIRATPTPLGIYDRGGLSPFLTYPGLWLGAAYVAAKQNVPLCWNASGVPAPFSPVTAELVRWTASVTDYLAIRDEASKRFLEEAGVSQDMKLVPDTAVEISKLWSEEELSEAYTEAFVRRGRSVPGRTLIFHVNSRWAGEDLSFIAARIDRICKRLDANAILMAIGPSHGDSEVQCRVAQGMTTDPLLVDRPQSLLEAAACIARSEAYFGSSLHGMVTSCSFGGRGMLVASREDDKYAGFLEHFGLSSWLVKSWAEAEQRVDDLFDVSGTAWERVPGAAASVLDRHWAGIREVLVSHNTSAKPTQASEKRSAIETLQRSGEDHFGDIGIFQAFIAERLEENYAKLQGLKRQLAEESQKLRQERQKLRQERQELTDARRENKEMRHELNIANWDVLQLTQWLETLDNGISALLRSRQWKIGSAIGKLYRRATFKPGDPAVDEYLEEVLRKFRAWREDGRDQNQDIKDGRDQ